MLNKQIKTMIVKPTCRSYSYDRMKIFLVAFAFISFYSNTCFVCHAFLHGDQRLSFTFERGHQDMGKGIKLSSGDDGGCGGGNGGRFSRNIMCSRTWTTAIRSKSDENKGDIESEDEDGQGMFLPGLPPVGASSYNEDEQLDEENRFSSAGDGSANMGFVGTPKFELQYL
uniref:Uncharacterized protein n=1 Tax=Eucampia antarctica TaxID=49252 RepID=A0A7S2SMK9_9STRA|mmetsp:Transcript_9976/g.9658  ORF Transcript_9976/g.9658 Transcript_9976/m.9658 type:complete len:170 (+) Transcript_9976:45-554(+)